MKLPVPRPLLPDDPLYQQAVNAMRKYDQAKIDEEPEAVVERLHLEADVTDYQLEALVGHSPTRH